MGEKIDAKHPHHLQRREIISNTFQMLTFYCCVYKEWIGYLHHPWGHIIWVYNTYTNIYFVYIEMDDNRIVRMYATARGEAAK